MLLHVAYTKGKEKNINMDVDTDFVETDDDLLFKSLRESRARYNPYYNDKFEAMEEFSEEIVKGTYKIDNCVHQIS